MIKIWGRKSSSNVQKAMWAVGELKLEHERIDVGRLGEDTGGTANPEPGVAGQRHVPENL